MVVVKKYCNGCERALPGAWDIGQYLSSLLQVPDSDICPNLP